MHEENRSNGIFHANVRNLEERFEHLLARSRERLSSADLVATYEGRVRAICDRLEPIRDDSGLADGNNEVNTAVKLISQFVDGRQGSLFRPVGDAMGRGTGPQTGMAPKTGAVSAQSLATGAPMERKFKPISVSAATKSRLDKQHQQQEILTDDMVDLSSQLKESVKTLGAKVGTRNALIDQTQTGLETSLAATKKNVTSIEKTRKSMRMNMCFSILVLFVVMAAFGGLLVFIRVTRFVGYKSTIVPTEL